MNLMRFELKCLQIQCDVRDVGAAQRTRPVRAIPINKSASLCDENRNLKLTNKDTRAKRDPVEVEAQRETKKK